MLLLHGRAWAGAPSARGDPAPPWATRCGAAPSRPGRARVRASPRGKAAGPGPRGTEAASEAPGTACGCRPCLPASPWEPRIWPPGRTATPEGGDGREAAEAHRDAGIAPRWSSAASGRARPRGRPSRHPFQPPPASPRRCRAAPSARALRTGAWRCRAPLWEAGDLNPAAGRAREQRLPLRLGPGVRRPSVPLTARRPGSEGATVRPLVSELLASLCAFFAQVLLPTGENVTRN